MKFLTYIKKRPIFTSIMFFLIIVTTSFSIKVRTSTALAGFGGKVLFVTECTCTDGAFAITVGTPSIGTYVYTPGSVLYSYYNFFNPGTWVVTGLYNVFTPFIPGPWVLGAYVPTPLPVESACWMYAVDGCFPLPTQGVITNMGTSLEVTSSLPATTSI